MDQSRDEVQISLIELIGFFIVNKKRLIKLIIIGAIFGGVISFFIPKEYQVNSKFFLIQNESKVGGGNPLMGYAQMLGVDSPTNLESFILAFVESKRIRYLVADEVSHLFESEINKKFSSQEIEKNPLKVQKFVAGTLELSQKVSIEQDKNDIFQLSFSYTDPEITYEVLKAYLNVLVDLNEELDIAAQKEIFTVLDEAEFPTSHYKPNIKKNIVFGGILGGFLGIFLILIQSFIHQNKDALNHFKTK